METLFSIDAKKILAKLHIAARQQANNDLAIINTGIINDDMNATPENPGNKISFDFDNKKMEYEVGIVKAIPQYKVSFSELFGKDYVEVLSSKLSKLNNIFKENSEELRKKITKLNEDAEKFNKKQFETIQKEAFEQLTTYFNNFVGRNNIKSFNADSMIALNFIKLTDTSKTDFVSDYVINPIKNDEFENKIKKTQKDIEQKINKLKDPKMNDIDKLADIILKSEVFQCFKVAYTLKNT